ncbi:ATPase [Sulfolobales archaeon HS-7]|nr:ATPase [Sulfolobales archaeon HS-7]
MGISRLSSAGSKYLLDFSALLAGVADKIEDGTINGVILLHESLISYIERLKKRGRVSGEIASEEINRIKELSETFLIPVEIVESKNGHTLNTILRKYCALNSATLITADETQKSIAEILGIRTVFLRREQTHISIEKFFTNDTMSVHLKAGTTPKAKRGTPGNWEFYEISNERIDEKTIKKYVTEIMREALNRGSSFIEVERKGSLIVQMEEFRIIITRTPLSDGWEITAVKPVTKKTLEEYNIDKKVMNRLSSRAEGIVIAGSPGMGKTTFAQALAIYYSSLGKIVKTIESPRDMHLPDEITQYSKNYAEIGELHDILLLSRPDYTVFDEMRNDEDFKLFIDLRLAGIGMIGVVHATTPIDAIHRFINRIDIGTIPNILDTIIFIKDGQISKIYTMEMNVKVPTGLHDNDLARPVVEIKDFVSDEVEYEVYVFGEQTMIIPVKGLRTKPTENRVSKIVLKYLPDAKVLNENGEVIVEIPRDQISKYNKRVATQIHKLEKKTGLKVRVRMSE